MVNSRIWLYRIVVLLVTAILVLSWFLPWWSLDIETYNKNDAIIIHPYGLEDPTDISVLLGVGLPSFFTPLIWTYFGLAIAIILIGLIFLKKDIALFNRKFNLSQCLIGIAGFSYLVVAIAAVIVAAIMTGDISGLPLIKRYYISMGGGMMSWVKGDLRFGYWLALAVGPCLIALAVLRNKIIGTNKQNK